MKILLVAPSVMPLGLNKYGGIELLVSTWSEALAKAGHDVTVAAPQGSKVPDGVKLIETVKLPQEQDHDELSEWYARQAVDPDGFDVIHDFSHRNAFRDEAIHMVWDPVSTRYPKASSRQITLSKWQKERFDAAYQQGSRIMPMWIDTEKMKPAESPTRERLLYFGAIVPAKGALIAIDYAKREGLELDVAGGLIPSEQDSPYLKAVQERCDGEKIRLHFNVSEEEKRTLIQNAKAVVYPVQQAEAHWMTGMECWCADTPTLTFDRGAMREITRREWGIVAETTAEFGYYMRKFGEPDFDRSFGGWQSAWLDFSIATALPKWQHLYELVQSGLTW